MLDNESPTVQDILGDVNIITAELDDRELAELSIDAGAREAFSEEEWSDSDARALEVEKLSDEILCKLAVRVSKELRKRMLGSVAA